MVAPRPAEETRKRIVQAVFVSVLVPGGGHLLARRTGQALAWFLACQGTLFAGLSLAGRTQLDFGSWLGFGRGSHVLFLLIPEMGNFLGSQVAAFLLHSIERGGRVPEYLPFRDLGHLLSGASGVLAAFAAAHAAGAVLAASEGRRWTGRLQPGTAACATLLLPGLGHWLTGRRFKAVFLGSVVIGLFLLGMALGEFADFHRDRHPYYWAGQMALGPIGWLGAWLAAPLRFTHVPAYIDAGLLFTTCAGLFTVVVALDAFRRAEEDGLAGDLAAAGPGQEEPDSAGEPAVAAGGTE